MDKLLHDQAMDCLEFLYPTARAAVEDHLSNASRTEAIEAVLIFERYGIAGPSLQEGPTPELTAAMVMGKSPRDLSGGLLTNREAHSWMHQSKHDTARKWLWELISKEHPEVSNVSVPESNAVITWVRGVLNTPVRKAALLKERTTAFGGYEIDGSLLNRLDELQVCDLSSSVTQTLEAAVNRAIKEEWQGDDHLIDPLKGFSHPNVTEITEFPILFMEGSSMRHCVAQYAQKIVDGEGRIFSVRTETSRSTAWVSPRGKLLSHMAFANSAPNDECKALLNDAIKQMQPLL